MSQEQNRPDGGTRGVSRRTIVAGAAWTIPAVAVAVTAPTASASGSPELKFTQAAYSGVGCSIISGVKVSRTTDGSTPDPSKTITVTLPSGYTFTGNATTYYGVSGGDGLITLPDITVPADGRSGTFTAVSDSLTAAASVTAQASPGTVFQYATRDTNTSYDNVPAGSKAVGDNFVLSSADNTLRDINGPVISTGVTSAAGYNDKDGDHFVTYTTNRGAYIYKTGSGSTRLLVGDYTNAQAVGDNFIVQDGTLRDLFGPDVSTGVISAYGFTGKSGNHYVTYIAAHC